MKKLLNVWMILSLVFVMAACSSNSSAPVAPAENKGSSSNNGSKSSGSGNEWDAMELGENGPVEIDFWHIQATIYGEAVHEIIEEFNKEYEGKIHVNEVFQGKYDELNKKVRASIQGGGLPNVTMAYEGDALEYMKANKIKPLDTFLASEKYGYTKAELDDIIPGALARQQIPQYDGKTMSWIHGNSSMGVYFNKDILAKAGYEKPAETWKEFEQQAIDIYEKTGVPALSLNANYMGGSFGIWLRTYGMEPVAVDTSSVNYDNEHAAELLTILKNLVDSGAAYFADNTEQEFTNQRAAMEIGTTARSSTKIELVQDTFDWEINLIPQGVTETKSTGLWGGNHVMFKSTPEEELASWIFMKYFASPDSQAIYAAKTGYFPATKSSLDTELLKQNFGDNPQKRQAFENVFPHARITVPTAASRAINDAASESVAACLNGTISPEDALKKMQRDATEALQQYN